MLSVKVNYQILVNVNYESHAKHCNNCFGYSIVDILFIPRNIYYFIMHQCLEFSLQDESTGILVTLSHFFQHQVQQQCRWVSISDNNRCSSAYVDKLMKSISKIDIPEQNRRIGKMLLNYGGAG